MAVLVVAAGISAVAAEAVEAHPGVIPGWCDQGDASAFLSQPANQPTVAFCHPSTVGSADDRGQLDLVVWAVTVRPGRLVLTGPVVIPDDPSAPVTAPWADCYGPGVHQVAPTSRDMFPARVAFGLGPCP